MLGQFENFPLLGDGNQGLSADEIKDEWSLETTVNVRNSTPGTYFMSVGWQPAGYGGIQDKGEERVVIFSMWNGGCGFGTSGERSTIFCTCWTCCKWISFADSACNCDNSTCVREVQKGTDVQVSEFGGEGTGMKSIKVVPWKDNEDVTMTLTGKRTGDKTWYME